MYKILCPSMMCAKYNHLEQEIHALEEAGIDIFHIDIMDGSFVPNFGMGLQDAELICNLAQKEVDVHLMIQEPARYIKTFADMGASIIYIHPESDRQPVRTLQTVQNFGMKAGIAVSPEVTIEAIRPLLSLADYILVMTVNPGFAGQQYLPLVDEKIETLTALKQQQPVNYHYEIMVDGACSPDKIRALYPRGVNGFILGTSALFGKKRPYGEIMAELRAI